MKKYIEIKDEELKNVTGGAPEGNLETVVAFKVGDKFKRITERTYIYEVLEVHENNGDYSYWCSLFSNGDDMGPGEYKHSKLAQMEKIN